MVVLVRCGGEVELVALAAGGDGGAGCWCWWVDGLRRRTTTPAWPWRRPEVVKEW